MFSCLIKILDNAFLLSSTCTALADVTGFYIKDCLILGNKIVLEEHTCMGVTRLEAGTG